ncbi:hypothetical protein [Actinomadura harenae]|uniref:hypothetical protein n=1 Tax=Actinomadura harenae TaxID=2483351 RepID=UPI0011C3D2A8|nr:hypothetical protein [Actinomadura harenae]
MGYVSPYVYQLIESSWGIMVSITAAARVGDGEAGEPVLADGSLRLAFSGAAEKLSDDLKGEIASGLARVAPRVARVTDSLPVLIEVSDISYMESDFQIEGLSVAMLRWAENEFGLDEQKILASFDRGSNRYNFDFGTVA